MSFLKRIFGRNDEMSQSELISVITHQFRTPLANVKWTLDAFLKGDQGTLTDEQEKLLTRAFDSTQRLITFVDDILAAHRVEKGSLPNNPADVNVYVIAENVVADLEPKAEAEHKKVILEGKITETPTIKADPTQVRMIIQNLLENALTYSPENKEIRISVVHKDKYVQVTVKDEGIGIPEEDKELMFQRMYRADNAINTNPSGTGLGLYIAKLLVEKNRGTIGFESEEGKGSTFFFMLPITTNV